MKSPVILPAGWALLPIKTTPEMEVACRAAQDKWGSAHCDNRQELAHSFASPRWVAMVEAAPMPPDWEAEPSDTWPDFPTGWQPLPTTATPEMEVAGYAAKDKWPSAQCDNQRELAHSFAAPRWEAMAAAAPALPEYDLDDSPIPVETVASRRETLVRALQSSKSWMKGYAEAFVDQYVLDATTAAPEVTTSTPSGRRRSP